VRNWFSKLALVLIASAFGLVFTAYFRAHDTWPWIMGASTLFLIGLVVGVLAGKRRTVEAK
jgi:Na+/melibiose symporter-like transporter